MKTGQQFLLEELRVKIVLYDAGMISADQVIQAAADLAEAGNEDAAVNTG